ncbi:MAG TPA: AMP-binding protein, partial [Nitrospirota bacterium]
MMSSANIERPWLNFYEEGVAATLVYPELTLGNVLKETAKKFPLQSALVFYGKRISYAELDSLANRFANVLTRLGVRKGDRVALMMPNIPQMIISIFGTLKTDAVAVPTNPLYHEHELEVQLNDCGAETLVAVDMFYPVISRVLPMTRVKNLVLCGIKDFLPFPLNLIYSLKAAMEGQRARVRRTPPVYDFMELLKEASPGAPDIPASPDDTAVLQYTGGTTGVPKGAILTHRNLVANAVQCRRWLLIRKDGEDRVMAVLPFFHVYGLSAAMNISVLIAAEMILLPKFHTTEVLGAIAKYRPTFFPGIQAMYLAISNHPKIRRYDLSSIKAAISGAGPLMQEVQEKFEQLTGARIVEGYGLSEASPVTHANPVYGRRKIGSIGLPWPDTEARIVDIETGGRVLPVGEAGELV